jgi:squalene-hopene/tetraprenyl-beta-curcumene cyclase
MRFAGPMFVFACLNICVSSAISGSIDQLSPGSKPQASAGPDVSTGWDKVAAAKYLDDRMDLWFENADKLHTGQGVTSCISCHTVIPYSMARPALGKAIGENKPAPQETKLLGEVVRRVETYASHEPFYDSQEEKSRGAEAVLNLVILAGEDVRQCRREASDPTRKALGELWERQRPDGAWNWLDFVNEPWESMNSSYYGATLAAIAVGTVPGYAAGADGKTASQLARLRNYLHGNYSAQNLYNQVWLLLASTRFEDLLTRDETGAITTQLLGKQNDDGGWSLQSLGPWTWSKTNAPVEPPGKPDASLLSKSDGYATGFITYTLRQAGLPANHPALTRARDWLRGHQEECQMDKNHWKCWRSYSLNYDREHGGRHGEPWRRMFMSDAATSFAVLALLPSD